MPTVRSLISSSSLFLLLVLVFVLAAAPSARAQRSVPPVPTVPVNPVNPGITDGTAPSPDPSMRTMNEKMALARNTQRQNQIISDSARLLDLAQKLNAEVSKSNKNQLSVSVVKEAGEIEKLAKSIKDKMRYGN